MTPFPPLVEDEVARHRSLLVRSVWFNGVLAAARSAPVETPEELAAFLVAGLAGVCEALEKVQGMLTRATMLTTRPIEDITGDMLTCVRSSPAAEPTASPNDPPT